MTRLLQALALTAVLALLLTACAPAASVPLSSMIPTVRPTSSTTPATSTPSADTSVVSERGPGVTLKAGDRGGANLEGGRYRVAWYAPACSTLEIEWGRPLGTVIAMTISLPSGEIVVDLPAGPGFLNRVADCDYTVRFEAAE